MSRSRSRWAASLSARLREEPRASTASSPTLTRTVNTYAGCKQVRDMIEGAKKEGVLRNHMILPDGHVRHSVYYSIVASEWPYVKARLLEMLSR